PTATYPPSLHDALPILLASFVALPPPNRFDRLLASGDLLAATDRVGNLFIPFDYSQFVPPDAVLTRFLEIQAPSLPAIEDNGIRSEEHTSELQSLRHLV